MKQVVWYNYRIKKYGKTCPSIPAYLISDKKLDGWQRIILIFVVLQLLEELDLLLAGQEVDGLVAHDHDCVGELIAQQPGLGGGGLAVHHLFVCSHRRNQGVHLTEAVLIVLDVLEMNRTI